MPWTAHLLAAMDHTIRAVPPPLLLAAGGAVACACHTARRRRSTGRGCWTRPQRSNDLAVGASRNCCGGLASIADKAICN